MAASDVGPVAVPTISVVMAMYNAECYLREAIDSILFQTYTNFEFIIVDDGSTDNSLQIAQSYHDTRIVLLCENHCGLVASLNLGIRASRGLYVARMDADDISEPDRFEMQIEAFMADSTLGLVGSWYEVFSTADAWIRELPLTDHDIKFEIPNGNPIGHGTTMYSRRLAVECGLYREQVFPTEDYDLWLRISERSAVLNLSKVLYRWRLSETQISTTKAKEMHSAGRRAKYLAKERLIRGRDQLGCSLPPTVGLSSAMLTTYFFSYRAMYEGRWLLALALWQSGFVRGPMQALRAWLEASQYYLRLLSFRRVACAALHGFRPGL